MDFWVIIGGVMAAMALLASVLIEIANEIDLEEMEYEF